MRVGIVDYGLGNLGSIRNMLAKIGVEAQLVSDPETVLASERLILPGVGAFDAGITRLNASGLRPVLTHQALERRLPILGICLGMHLLSEGSEEGELPGLGWLPTRIRRLRPASADLRVPHMGWNTVTALRDEPLLQGLPADARFYFVHSYHAGLERPELVSATTLHGQPMASVVRCGNLAGVQFHPEKSHRFGLALLRNFAKGET